MSHFVHTFSISNTVLTKKKEVLDYLNLRVPGILFTAIYLDDHLTYLFVKTKGRVSDLILLLLVQKGIVTQLLNSDVSNGNVDIPIIV
ncbi:hypothetical protein [Sphingobacterium sp. UBA7038]|uniref:hypothetical protein n=1 Tax=Sphingobacterium TaxID=28453 RepID=UPI000EBC4821|nr:hypothetical protein [Sphingobacterium sp. UBA7038]HAF37256.1 hypothetical protein [Sphingobacterium sp.]